MIDDKTACDNSQINSQLYI